MKNLPILVVGGAGFIGSHMVWTLSQAGYQPIVLDNFSKGHRSAVAEVTCVEGDIADTALLEKLFSTYHFSAVLHFAAFIEVGESVYYPEKYYQNNVASTLNLLCVMLKYQVKHFIFSSSAAVYGEPQYTPIDEQHPLAPLNPYGHSKQMVEQIIQDLAKSAGLRYAILRYFNAAGAHPSGRLQERHEPESHLIPLVLQVARKQRDAITVYGDDYPTPDGTCIRDFIHVMDLCDAHYLALQALWQGADNMIYNLGTGQGYSVQQVIDVAAQVTGCHIPVIHGARRLGDPAILVANATRAQQALNWQPKYSELESIIQHAFHALPVVMPAPAKNMPG